MTLRSVGRILGAGLLATSCASLDPFGEGPRETGEVELQVMSGFTRRTDGATSEPRRAIVLFDATTSMLRKGPGGRTLLEIARGGAADLMREGRPGEEIGVRALGHRTGAKCAVPDRVEGSLDELRPRTEGSLATALREVRTELVAAGAGPRSRIVLFSDLDGACGGDLCAEAASLAEAGVALDLRVVGDASPPACLASPRLPPSSAGWAAEALAPPPPPSFRLVSAEGDVSSVLASGTAGDGAVTAPAGLVALEIDLFPPERVGPFRLHPGEHVRVRVLDFPSSTPPERSWQVERSDGLIPARVPAPITDARVKEAP